MPGNVAIGDGRAIALAGGFRRPSLVPRFAPIVALAIAPIVLALLLSQQ